MRKKIRLMLLALISLSLFSCGDDKDENTDEPNKGGQQDEVIDDDVTLKNPELIYWKMDTKRGIPTLVTKFRNPNNVAITFSYKFVFKNGDETITENRDCGEWGGSCLAAGETMVNWGTPDISLNDAKTLDDIVVTITNVSKPLYTPVKITTTQDEFNGDNSHKIAFKADGDFTECDVTVLYYYNDELVDYALDYRFDSDQTYFYFENINAHTRYEIFYNAYK